MEAHGDPMTAFKDADYALLVGSRPRGPGMERSRRCSPPTPQIFTAQGKALDAVASRNGQGAGGRQPGQHQRLHRDEERARPAAQRTSPRCCAWTTTAPRQPGRGQDRQARGRRSRSCAVWGNHSPTMYADYRFATIDGKAVKDLINDDAWNADVLPADRGQARRRDHRGARPVVGRLGGQRRHRPHARLGARHERQVGDHGRAVRRPVRHPRRTRCSASRSPPRTASTSSSRACRSTPSARSGSTSTLKELQEEQAGVKHLL